MKTFFYPRLALTNIKKNGKVYIPYLLTSAFTVMMFYLIYSLSVNSGIFKMDVGASTMSMILGLGVYVVIIFSVIFLFYINSFIIKRRKKEVALYNILGMEKKHIMIMMLCETLLTTIISLAGGILLGVLFSKLMFLLLVKLVGFSTSISIGISMDVIIKTVLIYTPIFMISYLFNVIQIKLANPIELLRGAQTGEKEPKTKWLLTIIGFVTLGGGYYIAQTIEDPATAILLFFVAVILVIIGTYCLFTAGSIAILKMLKKNKHFYYQTKHFTSVSQLIYRMKQNAVGLASICILCTCILVMLSSTVSLYSGVQDTANQILDESFQLKFYLDEDNAYPNDKDLKVLYAKLEQQLNRNDIEYTDFVNRRYVIVNTTSNKANQVALSDNYGKDAITVIGLTLDEYNRAYHDNQKLAKNEIIMSSNYFQPQKDFQIGKHSFAVKGTVHKPFLLEHEKQGASKEVAVVFPDTQTLEKTLSVTPEDPHMNYIETLSIQYKDESHAEKANEILKDCVENEVRQSELASHYYMESHYSVESMLTQMYGSLFFLGIFLGVLFLIAAILIMYYKQLSEGYEDQKRFEIMQNVGMSKKEVKQTIRSQVLIFFFLPLIVAVIHMAFAFKMIVNMFSSLVLSGPEVFIICTAISVVVLTIIYSIVYILTARTYYKIVRH
ncbi:ABC transporter permease [Longibaculum muris]|uniref:ABC transporter permease n=1 Tax=Longibaculum muris TaxID=1796628 RepID=UPI003AB44FF3